MTLLEFARGPALQWSAIIFTIGMLWRGVALAVMLRNKTLSADRYPGTSTAHGVQTIFNRFKLQPYFARRVGFQYLMGWIWHIGFVITVFFFQVHIAFFRGLLGFGWPGLPNAVVIAVAALTTGILLILIVRRYVHPVLRYISTFDDYAAAIVTVLPFLTGFLAFTHAPVAPYETLFALHLLSICLLLVWMPFSKLFHVVTMFPSRYILGVKLWRRGSKA